MPENYLDVESFFLHLASMQETTHQDTASSPSSPKRRKQSDHYMYSARRIWYCEDLYSSKNLLSCLADSEQQASCPNFGSHEILNLILITNLPAGVAHIAAVPEVSKLTASSMPRFQAVLKEQIEAIHVSSSSQTGTRDSAQDSKEKIQSARQQSSILLMHRLPVYRTRMLQFSQLTAPSKVGEIS